jgi:hypothetical protein
MKTLKIPSIEDIINLRENVQNYLECDITTAQDWCASSLYVTRRAWQKWEYAENPMRLAYWELLNIKIKENLWQGE